MPQKYSKQSEKIQELLKRIETGSKEVFTNENYRNFLSMMSKFHRYSVRNCILISMQKPNATYVAGFHAWQKNFHRHVKKGEKGIQILGYMPHKFKEVVPKTDQHGKPIHDASGKPVTEEVEHIIPYYRPVYVYDVSQTDGEPLPKLTTELSGTVNQYSQLLTALCAVSPYPITFNQLPGYSPSCHGYCSYTEQQIVVRENMPQEQTIKTIIHEIAHAVIHAPQSDLPPDQKPDRQSCEVQAESIAFIVCNYLNIDSSEYTFPYIASRSSDYELKELQDSLQTIQTAANELIGQISSEIDKLQVQQKEPEHTKPLSLNERIAAAKDAAKKYNLERSLTTPEKENFNELECTASNI